MQPHNIHQTKKGVASLYAVVFATILFGVITLSFIRIILSESRQSDDDELSQSAYDSALAGIEDAKRAVNSYYACLNSGQTDCATKNPFDSDCKQFTSTSSNFKRVLGYDGVDGEIKIQETKSNHSGDTAADQAYTCIVMSKTVEDYRSTLTNDTRIRVIPLGIESASLSDIKTVELQWFSENNNTDLGTLYENKAIRPNGNDPSSKVPAISLTLLYTDQTFSVNDFNNSTATNYGTMFLLPAAENADGATNSIGWGQFEAAANSDHDNNPFLIKCSKGEFACHVSLDVNHNLKANGNAMLVISMPYGETISDFSIALYNSSGERINFEGVQVSVDSTGRANQLYRRVETRLEPADSYFPYPQFAAELGSGDDSKLWKNFWITNNCWTENGTCDNNGSLGEG